MTPRQLEAFVAGAEFNSFTEAARRLHLTPSAVSSLMSELEATLGFAVFERTTRKVVLTPDGREFLPAAMSVLRQLRLAETAAADVRNRSAEVIRVAAPLVIASAILPPLIARHRRTHPRVNIRIIDTGVEWLSDRVANGEADLALGPDRVVGPEVSRTPLSETPWVMWCSPQHPLAARPVLRWADLEGVEICLAGKDHEHSVLQYLTPAIRPLIAKATQIVDNTTTSLGLAAANVAVTLSPRYVRALAEPLGLVMRRLTEPELTRQICIYRPLRRRPTPAIEEFVLFVTESFGDGQFD